MNLPFDTRGSPNTDEQGESPVEINLKKLLLFQLMTTLFHYSIYLNDNT